MFYYNPLWCVFWVCNSLDIRLYILPLVDNNNNLRSVLTVEEDKNSEMC